MWYEPLSALDSIFLEIEDDCNHMHVALAAIFERGPMETRDGKLDVDRCRRNAAEVTRLLPKLQRRLAWVPGLRQPVLVDEPDFDLTRHIKFVELPTPGDDRQLKDLVGRICSEPLLRDRPLWEQWYIDGLEDGRFAVVMKAHHCLVDGVSGIAAIGAMLRTEPDATIREPSPWVPRAAPNGGELLLLELERRVAERGVLWDLVRERVRRRSAIPTPSLNTARRLLQVARRTLTPGSRTVLNPSHIGSAREFDGVRFELEKIRAIRRATRTKINDVVLAIVAGGVGRYLRHHQEHVERVHFRAMVPVSLHQSPGDPMSNEVSMMLVDLPIAERDPEERLRRVAETMREAKSSGQSEALTFAEALADVLVHPILTVPVKVGLRFRPFNLIVTNMPGPGFPLYLLGAKLLHAYPMVPLYANQAVGIAALSYDGAMYFGLNADAQHVSDLSRLTEALVESYRELEAAFAV